MGERHSLHTTLCINSEKPDECSKLTFGSIIVFS